MGRPRIPLTPVYDISINWEYYQRHQVPDANDLGCTHWDAGQHKQGYGMTHAVRHSDNAAIMVTTHRVAARLKYERAISSREMVLHSCSNMACMNPDHLFIGDRYDMQTIMFRNKRHRHGVPPRKPTVEDIVATYATEELERIVHMRFTEVAKHLDITVNRAKYIKTASHRELVKRQP